MSRTASSCSAAPSFAPRSWYTYAGVAAAPVGTLHQDGFRLRASSAVSGYRYGGGGRASERASYTVGDLMVGYRVALDRGTAVTAYAGGAVQSFTNRDSITRARGTRFGGAAQLELLSFIDRDWTVFAMAGYRTTWNTYFALLRPGYEIAPGLRFGPEIAIGGKDEHRGARFGACFCLDLSPHVGLSLSGGYQDDLRDRAGRRFNGVYGALDARLAF
ncbi:MAG: cellulose biosynthesis protein BcsS [Rhodospirillales bacterium]|nr:MAG: cellulose biosynthesis protein BcsS [Rhodospirillales bacterium]